MKRHALFAAACDVPDSGVHVCPAVAARGEMQSQFGEAYERYRNRTPRIVPRPRGANETLKEE